jgi:hypothetical protein
MGSHQSHRDRKSNHRQNGNQSQAQPWTHWSVMFVHSDIADAHIPPGPLRISAHLQWRIGTRTQKNQHIDPGIDDIARVCRMTKKRVIRDLRWLASHGPAPGYTYLAMILGRCGRSHHYKLLVSRRQFRIDPRLDEDSKLTVAEFAVLCYLSNAAGEGGFFYLAKPSTIAKRCQLSLNTVKKVLVSLEQKGYCQFTNEGDENQPTMVCELLLDQLYPSPEGEAVKRGNQICQKGEPALSKEVTELDPLLNRSIKNRSSPKKTHARLFSDSGSFSSSSSEQLKAKPDSLPKNQTPFTYSSDTEKEFPPHSSFNGSPPRCGLEAAQAWRAARRRECELRRQWLDQRDEDC